MATPRRLSALLLCVALGVFALECSKGKEGDACATDGECDLGFFCRTSTKVCTYECRKNSDCLSNVCDINGRCYVVDGGASDAGIADGGIVDGGLDASSDAGKDGGADGG